MEQSDLKMLACELVDSFGTPSEQWNEAVSHVYETLCAVRLASLEEARQTCGVVAAMIKAGLRPKMTKTEAAKECAKAIGELATGGGSGG